MLGINNSIFHNPTSNRIVNGNGGGDRALSENTNTYENIYEKIEHAFANNDSTQNKRQVIDDLVKMVCAIPKPEAGRTALYPINEFVAIVRQMSSRVEDQSKFNWQLIQQTFANVYCGWITAEEASNIIIKSMDDTTNSIRSEKISHLSEQIQHAYANNASKSDKENIMNNFLKEFVAASKYDGNLDLSELGFKFIEMTRTLNIVKVVDPDDIFAALGDGHITIEEASSKLVELLDEDTGSPSDDHHVAPHIADAYKARIQQMLETYEIYKKNDFINPQMADQMFGLAAYTLSDVSNGSISYNDAVQFLTDHKDEIERGHWPQ